MQVGFLIICVPTFFIALFGNTLVLVALYKNQELRSPFYFYLANIALADVIYILLSMLNILEYMLNKWILGTALCRLHYLLINTVHSSSVLTLAVASAERYISICRKHNHWLSTNYIKVICIVWIIAMLITSPMGYERTATVNEKGVIKCQGMHWSREAGIIYYTMLSVVLYLIPFTVILVTHFGIFLFIKARTGKVMELNICESSSTNSANISNTATTTTPTTITKDSLSPIQIKTTRNINARQRERNKRVFKTLVIIALCFFIALFPSVVTRFLVLAKITFPMAIFQISHLIMYLHPTVNFLIYVFNCTELRKTFKSLLSRDHSQDVATPTVLRISPQTL